MKSAHKPDPQIALEKGREELTELIREHDDLEVRIAKQQRRVAALAALVDESEESDKVLELGLGGLTDAVRTAVKTAYPHPLTAKQIRDRLVQLYFPVNEYSNFMASLHSVIQRLAKAGEVASGAVDTGKERPEAGYRWLSTGRLNASRYEGRYNKSRFNK